MALPAARVLALNAITCLPLRYAFSNGFPSSVMLCVSYNSATSLSTPIPNLKILDVETRHKTTLICRALENARANHRLHRVAAGQQPIQTPWRLAVHGSHYKTLAQSWCWQPTISNGFLSGSATESWQLLAAGAETKVGFVVECQGATITPDVFCPESVQLNGASCDVICE